MSEEGIVESNEKKDECSDMVYYSDGYNKITSKRFILGVNTHVLSNISSINQRVSNYAGDEGEANVWRNMALGLGGLLVFVGLFNISFNTIFGIIALAIGGGLIYKGLQMKSTVGATDDWAEYGVTIVNNAGETDSVTSEDEEKINKIIDAMNKAITENL